MNKKYYNFILSNEQKIKFNLYQILIFLRIWKNSNNNNNNILYNFI